MAKAFRKILTKTLLVLLLLAAGVLIVRAVLNSTTGQRLTKYLETTKAQGLPLRVKDLVLACPDSDNAAMQWKAAEALFQVEADDRALMNKIIRGFLADEPIDDAERKRLTALADQNRTLINLIAQAGSRSCFRYGDWSLPSYEVSQPKLVVMVQAIRLLAIDSVLRADQGEVTEALDQCLKGMRFIRLIADEPLLINVLVSIADMKALVSAFTHIAQDRPIAPDILTSWIAELDPLPWRARFLRFLPGERANMLEMGLDLINGKTSVITGAKKPGIFRRFYYWLIRPVLKAECLWMMKHWDGYTDMDTHGYWQMQDLLARKSREAAHPPWYFKMVGALLPEVHTAFYKEAMLEAMMLATRTGLTAKLYKAQNGRFPDNMEALVPGMLKEMPLDPFTGKPLMYRLQNGELLIYSLGSNLKDDGGRMTYMITQLVMDKDDDWTWRERIK